MKKYVMWVMALFCLFFSAVMIDDVNAWSQKTCRKTSGGRMHIESVAWVCKQDANPTCALWIGGSDSVDPVIYAKKASGDVTIRYYRMCIGGTASTKNVWVSKDNGAIDDSSNIKGGKWGHPKSKAANLNVGKFIVKGNSKQSKVNYRQVTINGQLYDEYSRVVNVKRQNQYASSCGAYSGACASMDETVTVRIPATPPKVTLTLTANAITTSGASIEAKISQASATVDQGGSASLTVKNKPFDGYTFIGWRDTATGSIVKTESSRTKTISSNTTVYAVYVRNITVKLTADAITPDGTTIESNISSASATIPEGDSATLTVNNKTINGYTFKGWRDTKTGSIVTTESSRTRTITGNTTVYAVYERNTFGGRIVLSGSVNAAIPDSGYATSNSGSPKYVEIKNCSPTTGCSAVFEDYVKRIAGSGTTPYTVSRTSNLFTTTRGITNNTNVKSGNSGNANGEKVVRDPTSGSYTLYPGMVVCESLAFKVYSTDTNKTTITLCAAATGNAQPPDPSNPGDPSGDTSLYNIKVKNNSVTRYNSWSKSVYAKPNDGLTYMASYYPLLQYTYHLIPGAIKFNSANTIYPANNAVNTNRYLGKDVGAIRSMFNVYRSNTLRDWNNGINVYSSNFATTFNQSYTYTRGEFVTLNRPHTEPNNHTVSMSEVGKTLDETVTTNINNTVNSTPTQVGFALSGNRNIANVITGNASKVASAIVPYNYTTDTKITTADNSTMFAGETFTVNYDYQVKPRYNSLTSNSSSDTYATSVGHPKWRLVMRVVGGDTWTTNEYSDSILSVPINQMKTGRTQQLQTTVNVPDVPAGTRVCMQSQVWPQNSGSADSLNKDGNGQWSVSGEKCFIVAKRPSIQVWGGNVYTQNPITTGVSTKNNIAGVSIAGINNYAINTSSTDTKRVFGSWGELGVIAGSVVSGFGSGASTGFAANNGGNLSPSQLSNPLSNADPGGSDRTDFCLRSQLTFANKCTSGRVGGVGNTSASSNAQNDKTKVLEKIAAGEHTELVGNTVAIGDALAEYTYSGNDLAIQCSGNCNVGSGIKMVRSDKNIAINSNIVYTGRYTELDKIPKVVIYANKVNISCGVTRIDALIIADRTVDTCPDSAGNKINQRKNSNQLVGNGAIIASKLAAHRTYGAATGINSIVPAEIINFDPSLYMWGGDDEGNGGNGDGNDSETGANNLNVTYIRELAPRK